MGSGARDTARWGLPEGGSTVGVNIEREREVRSEVGFDLHKWGEGLRGVDDINVSDGHVAVDKLPMA